MTNANDVSKIQEEIEDLKHKLRELQLRVAILENASRPKRQTIQESVEEAIEKAKQDRARDRMLWPHPGSCIAGEDHIYPPYHHSVNPPPCIKCGKAPKHPTVTYR